jgi:NTE family protein
MTGSTQAMEIGLVLQGGGALGAYEYGGITGLFDLIDEAVKEGRDITLKVVTGVSIGAINAACVVGATDRKDARRRLSDLWDDLVINTPPFVPPQVGRDLSIYSVPDFYTLRFDLPMMPTWTYIYDTHPLLATLAKHVDFAALNSSKTVFVVTAVDVESGELTRFSNRGADGGKPVTIKPQHVLASGSLPPQFPWTDIADSARVHHYWDGGIVDNTPLGDAIDAFSTGADVRRVLVIMNLFPSTAKLPSTFTEVSDRIDQLRCGNRLHQDGETAAMMNDLIATIEALRKLVPGDLPPDVDEKVKAANAYKLVEPVEISLVSDDVASNEYGFRDFSRHGVEARRKAGYDLTLKKLAPVFANQRAA